MRLRVSATLSPPNFSSTASATTSAAIASATTPAAGTAVTSLRWLMALAGSPVLMSTVASARGTVEIGFIAARTLIGFPVLMPPSMPPARLVSLRTPPGAGSISSCACEPRLAADAKPSPISTPLMAGMLIMAPASLASSLRSPCTWLPRPGGRPWTTTSITPPSVSPSFRAASISATIAALAAASRHRTGSASTVSWSPGPGSVPAATLIPPSTTTWLSTSAPSACARNLLATSPIATRAAVSLALARSSTGLASSWPYFCIPARSA